MMSWLPWLRSCWERRGEAGKSQELDSAYPRFCLHIRRNGRARRDKRKGGVVREIVVKVCRQGMSSKVCLGICPGDRKIRAGFGSEYYLPAGPSKEPTARIIVGATPRQGRQGRMERNCRLANSTRKLSRNRRRIGKRYEYNRGRM